MFPLGGLDNLLDAPRASKSRRKAEGGNGQQISAVAAGSTSFVEMDGAADEEDESDRAPRPPNSWILYRSAKSQEIKRDMEESGAWASSPPVSSRQRQAEISRTVSMMWKNEAKEVKDMYSAMAEERRLGHRQRYPNYKYRPKRRSSDTGLRETSTASGELSTASSPLLTEQIDGPSNSCSIMSFGANTGSSVAGGPVRRQRSTFRQAASGRDRGGSLSSAGSTSLGHGSGTTSPNLPSTMTPIKMLSRTQSQESPVPAYPQAHVQAQGRALPHAHTHDTVYENHPGGLPFDLDTQQWPAAASLVGQSAVPQATPRLDERLYNAMPSRVSALHNSAEGARRSFNDCRPALNGPEAYRAVMHPQRAPYGPTDAEHDGILSLPEARASATTSKDVNRADPLLPPKLSSLSRAAPSLAANRWLHGFPSGHEKNKRWEYDTNVLTFARGSSDMSFASCDMSSASEAYSGPALGGAMEARGDDDAGGPAFSGMPGLYQPQLSQQNSEVAGRDARNSMSSTYMYMPAGATTGVIPALGGPTASSDLLSMHSIVQSQQQSQQHHYHQHHREHYHSLPPAPGIMPIHGAYQQHEYGPEPHQQFDAWPSRAFPASSIPPQHGLSDGAAGRLAERVGCSNGSGDALGGLETGMEGGHRPTTDSMGSGSSSSSSSGSYGGYAGHHNY